MTSGGPGSIDAVEIALEAAAADRRLDNPVRAVLDAQARLIARQTRLARWQIVSERTGALIKILTIVAGLAVLGSIAAFVWSASRVNGVVVTPFAVPPDLAARGLNGPVVAAQLLDKLTKLQAETNSTRAASTFTSNWGDDIAVEVPYAGVSIGELRRALRATLGSQTILSGEIVRLPDGRLAVTSRVGANPATRGEGRDADLDGLLQRGAEAIYNETQPYRYAIWLRRQERRDESIAILKRLADGQDQTEKVWGIFGLASDDTDYDSAMRRYRKVLALRPNFGPALSNMGAQEVRYGREEASYRLRGQLLDNAEAIRRELTPGLAEYPLTNARATRAALTGDFIAAAAQNRLQFDHNINNEGNLAAAPLLVVRDLAKAHDPRAALRVLDEFEIANPAAIATRIDKTSPAQDPRADLFEEIGDWPMVGAVSAANLVELAQDDGQPSAGNANIRIRATQARLARALAHTGAFEQATATLRSTPLDCAPCTRARGAVASLAGDHATADRWFALAVRLTPSLPLGHQAWAEARLLRGDVAGAIAQARLAVSKGPRWADPQKTWGDALMRAGKPGDAAARYAEAARLAPAWADLHVAWARALAASGDADGAALRLRTARTLQLTPDERARIVRLWRSA